MIVENYQYGGFWWADLIGEEDWDPVTCGPFIDETAAVESLALTLHPAGYANTIYIHQDRLWSVPSELQRMIIR